MKVAEGYRKVWKLWSFGLYEQTSISVNVLCTCWSSACSHMDILCVCVQAYVYVTGKLCIPTHTYYMNTFVQHPHIYRHTTQYAHNTCTHVHLYAVCMLCHAEVEDVNLLFIAMAGTHQIWVHFLEDTKWRKGEWVDEVLHYCCLCPIVSCWVPHSHQPCAEGVTLIIQ